ncbi:hypothetical protein CYMTET_10129 [Cymbomonas tetramitiformis]|uniref:AAA+ ATPase domain-containing protein n=1 Tax=Cymbomonas tetramitiformis TaxID=36881 RepID=A0AAE0GQ21_9CHLO|nr:hypothetical protein CYMTET_10129 [Cymbomonas tetramitiformis]
MGYSYYGVYYTSKCSGGPKSEDCATNSNAPSFFQTPAKVQEFSIYEADVFDENNQVISRQFMLRVKPATKVLTLTGWQNENSRLHRLLESVIPEETSFNSQNPEPEVPLDRLLFYQKRLQSSSVVSSSGPGQYLRDNLEIEFLGVQARAEELVTSGMVTFDLLWYILERGKGCVSNKHGAKTGMEITSVSYKGSAMGCPYFQIIGTVIKSNGIAFVKCPNIAKISYFSGPLEISKLSCQPVDGAAREKLIRRGRLYRDIALGSHYLGYKGLLIKRAGIQGQRYYNADGRIMADTGTFARMNPGYDKFLITDAEEEDTSTYNDVTVPDEDLFMTWPWVHGFSFASKAWGEVKCDDISRLTFRDDAFDKLVLDPRKKSLVRGLVENHKCGFSDLISGKGCGCIFLLHGPPGVGKTLTAEAIAELLHRPLYSITVGELGTSPQELEAKLSEVLALAHTWNAVILLDEADTFLEVRSSRDVVRNSLVTVFLRLLEYHQGVLFLTSNRVETFDPAFHSRISVTLKYDDLDESARRKIWSMHLDSANSVGRVDIDRMATFSLNGRQIKNIINISQAWAKQREEMMSTELIKETIGISFAPDIMNTRDSGQHTS